MYKCKICGKKYTELSGLYSHIEKKHAEAIPMDMSVQQFYYFMKTGRQNGNCVMCKKPTTWNKNTNKYNRFCGDPACKAEYVRIAKSRMIAKYGKVHLLNDPNKQREMLANRKISGKYRWSESNVETTYTGSYELDFLKTLDNFFEWDPIDISMPSPHTYTYMYEGEQKFYIPDVFIHSLDLEIEIKDGGDNPNNHYKIQAVDKEKERLKDEVMTSQKMFHYIKITNKNYTNLFEFLKEVKDGFEKYGDEKKIPRIFKIEDIKTKAPLKPVNESFEVDGELEYLTEVTAVQAALLFTIGRTLKKEIEKTDKYKKYKTKIDEIMKNDKVQFAIRAYKMIKIAIKVSALAKTLVMCKRLLNYMDSSSDVYDIVPDKYKDSIKEIEKEIDNKMTSIKESSDYNLEDEVILTEGFVSDLVKDFQGKTVLQNKFIVDQTYNVKKESPNQLKDYLSKIIKASKTEDDLKYIKELVGKSDTYYHNLMRKKPELQEEYYSYMKWVDSELPKEIKEKLKKINESTDIVEEKFEPDKALVWFDKPIDKLLNRKITLYHGSIEVIKDSEIEPISVNVGATKLSKPRWSTYFWDNIDDAIKWASTWAVNKLTGTCFYRGHQDRTAVGKKPEMSIEEFEKFIVNNKLIFYVYETEIPASKLEIGSVPSIKEYTLSEPAIITKRNKFIIDRYILTKYFEIMNIGSITDLRQNTKFKDLKYVRNNILNNILDNQRDVYRKIIRDDIKSGKIKTGDDLSGYRKSINKHIKNDTYGLRENVEVVYESSISMSQLNKYLQNEYDKELKKYLNDYTTFYHRMLKEKPDMVPHLNEDIKRAIIFIDGLANKGVSNDLLQTAKHELGDLVELNKHTKVIKQSKFTQKLVESDTVELDDSYEDNVESLVVDIKVIYESTRPFTLTDLDSMVEINGRYVMNREKVGTLCSIKPGRCVYENKSVSSYQVKFLSPVNIDASIKDKLTNGVRVNSLFNLNDLDNKFINEVCLRLFGSYPESCTLKE